MSDDVEDILCQAVAAEPPQWGEVPPMTREDLSEAFRRIRDAPPVPTQPILVSARLAAEIRRERGLPDDAPLDSEMLTTYVFHHRIEDC